ncbi:hypothetical protein FH972_023828 [Carpinus fangiana]|uniref:AMP-dependent synthetase/ligase domain-containing protein n=1 Tax=Carpinus fangiana TaxID=176857 RepID=A0A5N6KWB0_9ROSI|nr:hypothetical protein FH972_023828 [Carpinus fangiana]
MPFLSTETHPIPEQDIISWYFDAPRFDQSKPIYVDALDPSRAYTAADCKTLIRKLCAGFVASGLQSGDCVCLHSFNDINYPILVNGIVAFGGVFAGANPSYTVHEMVHHLKTARVRMLIVEPELLSTTLQAAKEAGLPRSAVLVFDHKGNEIIPPEHNILKRWRSLLDHGERDWVRLKGTDTRTTTAARLFSSGTTGLPKAAILSHYNLVAEHELVSEWKPKSYDIRRIVAIPMFHAAAVPGAHFSPLRNGAQIFILRRFELEPFLASIERHQITDMAVVPPMVIAIIMSDLSKKYSLTSVKHVTCGAAPLDKGPQARLKQLLVSETPFSQVWGMTETSCICSMLPWPEDDASGSVGHMLPGVDAKLVDDNGKDVSADDVRGELCVRGSIVISGYFENPEANARDWDKEGYFHTGDIAFRSKENGLFYIVDRKKELIKVRGFQVAPPELEAVLLSHPLLIDAAVIGVQFGRDESELPRAYVVRRLSSEDATKLTEGDIKTYMKGKLARYKELAGGVKFMDAIPKNPSGKILKRVLREMARKEIGAKL